MKRSEINELYRLAKACFAANGWRIPPNPKWDITDCGAGSLQRHGIALINLAEEPEYCEKLIYMRRPQVLVMHTHRQKKEDIICRNGRLAFELWEGEPNPENKGQSIRLKRNGEYVEVPAGEPVVLEGGERLTLTPGIWHSFWPESDEAVIGEVSTANDDVNDNVFWDENLDRFPQIEEDEAPAVILVSDKS